VLVHCRQCTREILRTLLFKIAAMSGKSLQEKVKASNDGGPKCANGGCTKQGLHRCGGCKSAMYCSAACQKVHWKQGGTSKNAKSLQHRPDQQGWLQLRRAWVEVDHVRARASSVSTATHGRSSRDARADATLGWRTWGAVQRTLLTA
jgi:hypothetical protein